jgi:hypothetical protein
MCCAAYIFGCWTYVSRGLRSNRFNVPRDCWRARLSPGERETTSVMLRPPSTHRILMCLPPFPEMRGVKPRARNKFKASVTSSPERAWLMNAAW